MGKHRSASAKIYVFPIAAQAGKRPRRNLSSTRKRYNIWRVQKGLCAICGKPMGDEFEIDHKTPFCKGGQTIYPNLQAVHIHCNRRKGINEL